MSDLTDSMRRELRSIHLTGEPEDPAHYHAGGAMAFYARDKVRAALLRRELIRDEPGGFVVTDAGCAALGVDGGGKDPS